MRPRSVYYMYVPLYFVVLPDRFNRGIVVTNDAKLIFQPMFEQNNNISRLKRSESRMKCKLKLACP